MNVGDAGWLKDRAWGHECYRKHAPLGMRLGELCSFFHYIPGNKEHRMPGPVLERLRAILRLDQEDMAFVLGIKRSVLDQMEHGVPLMRGTVEAHLCLILERYYRSHDLQSCFGELGDPS